MSEFMNIVELSLMSDMSKLSTISHNISNAATNGYKREISMGVPFEYYLTTNSNSEIPLLKIKNTSTQVRTFDVAQGNITPTNNPLDLAIEGNGFFVVETGMGESYVRNGSFKINSEGDLVTKNGHVILGESGSIKITSQSPNITIDGDVWDGDVHVGKLVLVEAEAEKISALVKDKNGYFNGSGINFYPATNSHVLQGHLETSNVKSAKEMIGTLETIRHFELSQKLIHMKQEMFNTSIDALGTF